ncbi:hypothetical protein BaRGS_00007687 [Batillaria attramentaria]|uniref:Uncharacterized protein n=1 Tax=Batillaria attramentaria TaxID=370345 RepID=A0ABD0LPE3_9CAEN
MMADLMYFSPNSHQCKTYKHANHKTAGTCTSNLFSIRCCVNENNLAAAIEEKQRRMHMYESDRCTGVMKEACGRGLVLVSAT